MVETEYQAPTFIELTAADLTKVGDIALQFLAKDNQLYRVEIAKGIIGAMITTTIGLLNKTQLAMLDTTRRESDPIMSLRMTGFRPMMTTQGAPALALVLENALEVGLELKRGAIPALKNALDQLENLTSPPTDEKKH